MASTKGKRSYSKKKTSENSGDDEENVNENVATSLPLFPPRNNIPALVDLDDRDIYLVEKSRYFHKEFTNSAFYYSEMKYQNIEIEPYTKQNINLIDYLKPYFPFFPEELYSQRKVPKKPKLTEITDVNVDLIEENEESNEEEDEEEGNEANAEDDIDLEEEGDYAYQSFDDDDDQVEEDGFDEPTL